jgi:hypothetical protein
MKSKIAPVVFLICLIAFFNGFTQRTSRPPTNYPSVIDADAISKSITKRYNSINAGADYIQSRVNQLNEKLGNLQYVDKTRYNKINMGIESFVEYLNSQNVDFSNSTNKRLVDSHLTEISNTIDKAFKYREETIEIPVWWKNEEGTGWTKGYLQSTPK